MLGRNRFDRDDRRGGGRGRDGILGCLSRYSSTNMLFLGSQESFARWLHRDTSNYYLEPQWPRFLKVNFPKQGLFKSKQGVIWVVGRYPISSSPQFLPWISLDLQTFPKKFPHPRGKSRSLRSSSLGSHFAFGERSKIGDVFRLFCEGVVFVFFDLDIAIGFLLKSALVPVILDILGGVTSPEAVTWCHRGRWLWQLLSCMVGIDMKESCFLGSWFSGSKSPVRIFFFGIFSSILSGLSCQLISASRTMFEKHSEDVAISRYNSSRIGTVASLEDLDLSHSLMPPKRKRLFGLFGGMWMWEFADFGWDWRLKQIEIL